MYIDEEINHLEQVVEKYGAHNIELILDTNICIFLRDFYNQPNSIIMKSDGAWEALKKLLFCIEHYDLEVDYSIGMEEACRNKNDFSVNYGKANEMHRHISTLFSMDYFQMLEHGKLVKVNSPTKDKSERQNTKIQGLLQPGQFHGLLFNTYATLLKLYLLNRLEIKLSKVEKMVAFLDFLEKEVDMLGGSDIVFGSHYLSGNDEIKKLIHNTKNTEELKIHSLWNAAIDLTMPTLVGMRFIKDKAIPIFVTGDKVLWYIFNSMKMRMLFINGDKSAHPPFIELNFENAGWTKAEYRIINSYHKQILERRKYKFVFQDFDFEQHLIKMRDLCYRLENELKFRMKNG
jgi:hypothetical protein